MMARTETAHFPNGVPARSRPNLPKDPLQSTDTIKTEFTAREGLYKIASLIDNLGKYASNTCLSEPVKLTCVTRVQIIVDEHSETSSRRSSTTSQSHPEHGLTERQRCQSLLSQGSERNQQNGNILLTELLAFNLGRELIVYEFPEATQINANEPIDHHVYKQNHQPTCHDLIQHVDSHVLHILVGFSKGQIQYINMQSKEQKVFNEGSYLDKTKVTCIKWLSLPRSYFAVSYASGCLYIFDEQLNCQRDITIQPIYSVIKDEEKNFSISYTKKNSKDARNPLARWSIGSGSLNEFAFSPDQRLLAVVSQDGFLRIFHYEKMELIAYMKSYFGGLLCVCWSPDGKYLATGGEDDLITLFSLESEDGGPQVLCRGCGHTSWISAISFDPYINAKIYYSSIVDRSSSSFNGDDDHGQIHSSIPYSPSNASSLDKTIPSVFYRLGSVGQDNRLCFWDITEDVLKLTKIHSSSNSTHLSNDPLPTTSSNGYASFLSDTTSIGSSTSSRSTTTTTKSSFSSLTSRLSFSRHSNKIHKSIQETPDNALLTLTHDPAKKTRRLPLLSSSTASDSKSSATAVSANDSLSRRTNLDLTRSSFGTHLCPKLDDIQIIEPTVSELISHERLNGIHFGETSFFTSSQDGIIAVWAKPSQLLINDPSDD